jgi:hypothetical protein
VSELIELLEEQDPDAEVLVMMQQNWPFECSLAGVPLVHAAALAFSNSMGLK